VAHTKTRGRSASPVRAAKETFHVAFLKPLKSGDLRVAGEWFDYKKDSLIDATEKFLSAHNVDPRDFDGLFGDLVIVKGKHGQHPGWVHHYQITGKSEGGQVQWHIEKKGEHKGHTKDEAEAWVKTLNATDSHHSKKASRK
jgi:hypothetical protein